MNRVLLGALIAAGTFTSAVAEEPTTGYASVNGLEMYYEIHGAGEPLVLLHGAYMSIPSNWAASSLRSASTTA